MPKAAKSKRVLKLRHYWKIYCHWFPRYGW